MITRFAGVIRQNIARLRDQLSRTTTRDQEFLPAALEILETPPSPVRMALLLAICALATVSLLWSALGTLDIVAIAPGKIQPAGRVKIIQPLETGRVDRIRVENGQKVKEGDVLIELDASDARADVAALTLALASWRAEVLRRRAALEAASTKSLSQVPSVTWGDNIPAAVRMREERVLTSDLATLSAMISSLQAQSEQKKAEEQRLLATIAAQELLIATQGERVKMRQTLVDRNSGTRASVIDATESMQYQMGALASQKGQVDETRAVLTVLQRDIAKTYQQFISDNSQKLDEAERQVDDTEQRLAKAAARLDRMTLYSPLDGTVSALSVSSRGQVVTTGEEIMRIVPGKGKLEVEAYVQNKDIGFIKPDQQAILKIESFPFTRHGVIPARVLRVAHDAVPEPDTLQSDANAGRVARSTMPGGTQRTQNLVFPIILNLESEGINVDGAIVPLSPGMAVSVEIKTGKRRMIEYLFSPLLEISSEAMRER